MSEDSKGPPRLSESEEGKEVEEEKTTITSTTSSSTTTTFKMTVSDLEKLMERKPAWLLTLVHLVDWIDLTLINDDEYESLSSSPEVVANLVQRRVADRQNAAKTVPIYLSVYAGRLLIDDATTSSTDEVPTLSSTPSKSLPSSTSLLSISPSEAFIRLESVEGISPRFHRILRSVTGLAADDKQEAFFYFLAQSAVTEVASTPSVAAATTASSRSSRPHDAIYVFASSLDSDLKTVSTNIFPVLYPSSPTAVASIRDALHRASSSPSSSAAATPPPLQFRATLQPPSASSSPLATAGDRDSGQFSTPATSTPFCSVENIAESTTEDDDDEQRQQSPMAAPLLRSSRQSPQQSPPPNPTQTLVDPDPTCPDLPPQPPSSSTTTATTTTATETPHVVQLRRTDSSSRRSKTSAPFFQRFSSVIDYHSSSSSRASFALEEPSTPSPGQRRRRSIDFGGGRGSSSAKASRNSTTTRRRGQLAEEDDDVGTDPPGTNGKSPVARRASTPIPATTSSKAPEVPSSEHCALSMPAKLTTTATKSHVTLPRPDVVDEALRRKNLSANDALEAGGFLGDESRASIGDDIDKSESLRRHSNFHKSMEEASASPSSILGEDDSFAKYVANRMRTVVSPGTSEDASFVTLQDTRSPIGDKENEVETKDKKQSQPSTPPTTTQQQQQPNNHQSLQQNNHQAQQPLQQQHMSPEQKPKMRSKEALKKRRSSEVGRVASWATKFEKLICDEWGRDLFKQFLRQEYSEENMRFWEAVEDFRMLTNKSALKKAAKKIFEDFIADDALDSVNVDAKVRVSVVEALKNGATANTFTAAQQQILGLMKSDSYPRFLKSALYKTQLVEEMEGRKFPCQLQRSATLMPDMMNLSSSRKSDVGPLKSTNDLLLSKDQKLRQSLLPWNRNKKPKKMSGRSNTEEISSFFGVESSTESACSTTTTVSAQPAISTSHHQHRPAFGVGVTRRASEKDNKKSRINTHQNKKSSSSEDQPPSSTGKIKNDASSRLSIVHKLSALTLPLHKMRGSRFGSRESLSTNSGGGGSSVGGGGGGKSSHEDRHNAAPSSSLATAVNKKPAPTIHCKIRIDYLPAIEYKSSTPTSTIKETLTTLLRANGISHSSFDCYHLNSDRPLNVESHMTDLNEKEIVVESRVLFRLDFPALVKSLGIKARPNKPFLDILKPLLKRYNFTTRDVDGVKLVLEKDASELWAKDLESSVAADFDNDRITVLKIQEDLVDIPFVDSEPEATPPPPGSRVKNDNNNVSTDSRDLSSEDATMNSGKEGDDDDEENEENESLMNGSGGVGGIEPEEGLNVTPNATGSPFSPRGKPPLCSTPKTQSEEVESLSPTLRRGAKVTSV